MLFVVVVDCNCCGGGRCGCCCGVVGVGCCCPEWGLGGSSGGC